MKLSLIVASVARLFAGTVSAQSYRHEAEKGILGGGGTPIQSTGGASGWQYVRLNSGDSNNSLTVIPLGLPDGPYESWVGYRTPFGEKGYYFAVGGISGSGMFDASASFAEDLAGIFSVNGGLSLASISQYWGYQL